MNLSTIKNLKINYWDSLTSRFDTYKTGNSVHPDAAVNIHVGWPTLFFLIQHQKDFLAKKSLDIMDFGCGAGHFAKELIKKGHKLTCVDRSVKMLDIAKKHLPKNAKIYNEDHTSPIFIEKDIAGSFDIVTSVHSLEWIKDIDKALNNLAKAVRKNGIVILVLFPKKHIVDSIRIKDLFEDFDSDTNPTEGIANFDGVKVPVYIREAEYFDRHFKDLGFEKVIEYYPEYPADFFKKYKWTGSKEPEMMILSYRKK